MKIPDPKNLSIVIFPDPVLKRVCKPVEEYGQALAALADRMLELVREKSGVGLAAPQVGIPICLFVCNATGEPEDDHICVNPRLSELEGVEEREEGCLSIPDVNVTMRRATKLTIDAQDTSGKPFCSTAVDLLARIMQHEFDHLQGKLITDNMSTTDEIANRRALKQLEADFAANSRRRRK